MKRAANLEDELRDGGARLVPIFTAFEGVCLDVGRQLGDALPGLGSVAQTLGEIAAALDGPQMAAAIRDLEAILAGLRSATQTLDEESRVLRALGRLVREIGPQARKVQSMVRSVTALVFTLKIESAQLPAQSDEMIAFARTLQDLAVTARDALDVYVATQVRLSGSLRASSRAHDAFQVIQREALETIAVEIGASLKAIASRRGSAGAGLREIGDVTRDIGRRIGECVVGCQIGDTTRQRVEHVAQALEIAADALGREASGQPPRLAARLVELQLMQIEDASREFARETDKVAASLAALADSTLDLEARSQRVFGLDDGADGSFLQVLAKKLAAAQSLVSEGFRARRDVDKAKREASVAMAEMKMGNDNLEEVAANVTMIGTNASLRSAQLGDAGKGITLVSAELRGFGRQIRSGIYQLGETLGQAIEIVEQFSLSGHQVDAQHIGDLEQRMAGAIQTFGGASDEIWRAQDRLGVEASSAHDKLDLGARALAHRAAANAAMAAAYETLTQASDELQGGREKDEAVDEIIAQRLRPSYSMAQERRVHDRFEGIASREPEPEPAAEADAFLL